MEEKKNTNLEISPKFDEIYCVDNFDDKKVAFQAYASNYDELVSKHFRGEELTDDEIALVKKHRTELNKVASVIKNTKKQFVTLHVGVYEAQCDELYDIVNEESKRHKEVIDELAPRKPIAKRVFKVVVKSDSENIINQIVSYARSIGAEVQE